VLLDVSPPPLVSLRIEGALVFDERDPELTAGHVLVLGTVRVGTSAAPFRHRAASAQDLAQPDARRRRVRLTLPYPQAALTVIRDYNSSNPLPSATDLVELEASPGDRYWYDAGTGMLHLNLVTRSDRTWATVHVDRSNASSVTLSGAKGAMFGMVPFAPLRVTRRRGAVVSHTLPP
jgi:hypothetical protein